MRLPPEAPTAIRTPSRFITRAGVMLLSGSLPGAMELMRPGTGSNHIMPLFMITPVPLGMMPEPKPDIIVFVMETALPSPSVTTRWVVPCPRRDGWRGERWSVPCPPAPMGLPASTGAVHAVLPIDARRSSVYSSETRPFQGTSANAGSARYWKRSA